MHNSNSLTHTVASSFVCTSPLAAVTVTGLLVTRTVSTSAEFQSSLLNMCIDGFRMQNQTNTALQESFKESDASQPIPHRHQPHALA